MKAAYRRNAPARASVVPAMAASGKEGEGRGRGRNKGRPSPSPHCVGGLTQERIVPACGIEMGGRVGSEVGTCGASKMRVSVIVEAQYRP